MTTVAVLGGSGQVGRRVVAQLVVRGARVVLLHRRVVPGGDSRLIEHVVDMDRLEEAAAPLLEGVDAVVSTMGIGSGKGSAAEFRRVEVELPSAFARAARRAGAKRAVLLTAVGADVASTSAWLALGAAEGQFFHFKGLVEQNFADVGLPEGVVVLRPAGLLGTGHVPAAVEWLVPKLDWMAPARFRSLHVERLAEVIAALAVTPRDGGSVTVLEGESLLALVGRERTRPDRVAL